MLVYRKLGDPISKGNAEDISHQPLVPVNSLNPYQNRWTIKVRATFKGPLKTYSNARTQNGKLFHFDVVDANRGELRVTMFNEIAELFNPIIQVGCVYYISRGTLKFANKKFTTIKNEYELTLDNNSIVQQAEDDGSIGGIEYQFVPIGEMANRNSGDIVDVLAVVVQADTPQSVTVNKNSADGGRQVKKRNIKLLGMDGKGIDLTLWDPFAESADIDSIGNGTYPILAVKGAKVSDFNGRSLNTVAATIRDWNAGLDHGGVGGS